jgi:phospholipase A2
MSNNLPSHIFARPERGTDVIIAFDASSDVHRGSAIQRIQNFADDCHLDLEEQTDMFDSPKPRFRADADGAISAGMKVESKFLSQYTRVFRGRRENGQELYLIYCPLLPNGWNPEFDPSVSALKFCSVISVQGADESDWRIDSLFFHLIQPRLDTGANSDSV